VVRSYIKRVSNLIVVVVGQVSKDHWAWSQGFKISIKEINNWLMNIFVTEARKTIFPTLKAVCSMVEE
jgi:hypothetical protein